MDAGEVREAGWSGEEWGLEVNVLDAVSIDSDVIT